jgi:phage shock protein PspC (stress-responsive transcriptional regulator)
MQDVQTRPQPTEEAFSIEPDALFGVCQAVGEDFGFDPFYLRVALLGLLFFNPFAVIGAYVVLGAAVALARWLFPKPAQASAVELPARVEVQSFEQDTAEQQREPELVAA